jgi:hypothetical protein
MCVYIVWAISPFCPLLPSSPSPAPLLPGRTCSAQNYLLTKPSLNFVYEEEMCEALKQEYCTPVSSGLSHFGLNYTLHYLISLQELDCNPVSPRRQDVFFCSCHIQLMALLFQLSVHLSVRLQLQLIYCGD